MNIQTKKTLPKQTDMDYQKKCFFFTIKIKPRKKAFSHLKHNMHSTSISNKFWIEVMLKSFDRDGPKQIEKY
jgi:hypothetical protein